MCRDLANLVWADDDEEDHDDGGGNDNGQLFNANNIGPIWQNVQDFDEDASDNGGNALSRNFNQETKTEFVNKRICEAATVYRAGTSENASSKSSLLVYHPTILSYSHHCVFCSRADL